VSARVRVPEAVRRKARACGVAGDRWLDQLPRVVADVERAWGIEVGDALAGGSGSYVAGASTADGRPAVLKMAIPDGLDGHSPFATELEALRLGDGLGYVRIIRADERGRCLLLERLGRPLRSLGLPVEAQIDVVADTLRRAWREVPATSGLRSGADQAEFLRQFIDRTWERLGRPGPASTVELAAAYAQRRRDAVDAAPTVLIHGDAHPANVLEDPGGASPSGFKLIDPDGMRSEPAHDLAIPLRDWSDELLAADPVELGRRWSRRLGEQAEVPADAIWEWAFVERVSTGLFMLDLGDPAGARLLAVADAWARAGS
jgi:streptomycin 6-kinase